MLSKFDKDTLVMVNETNWNELMVSEVSRLIRSGMLDDNTTRSMLFGIALENISDNYIRGDRKTKAYKKMKCI